MEAWRAHRRTKPGRLGSYINLDQFDQYKEKLLIPEGN